MLIEYRFQEVRGDVSVEAVEHVSYCRLGIMDEQCDDVRCEVHLERDPSTILPDPTDGHLLVHVNRERVAGDITHEHRDRIQFIVFHLISQSSPLSVRRGLPRVE